MTVLAAILLALLAVIVVVLIVPFGVHLVYIGGEFALDARLLCFNIGIIPGKERQGKKKERERREKKPPKSQKAEGEPEAEGQQKGLPLGLTREDIPPLIKLLCSTLDRFRRKFTVNRLMIHFVAAAEDPYDAAMMYGWANAAAGVMAGLSERGWDIRRRDIQTAVDFESTEMAVDAELTVTISLGRILAVLVFAAWGFLKIKRASKKREGASKDERMDNDGTDADPDGGIPAGQHV